MARLIDVHKKTSVRIAELRAKIWTQDLPNMKQEWPIVHPIGDI
jgi:hypothetical protein